MNSTYTQTPSKSGLNNLNFMDEFKTTDACEKYKCESKVVNILSDTCIMQVQSITNKTNSQVCNSGQNYQIKSLHFITFQATYAYNDLR